VAERDDDGGARFVMTLPAAPAGARSALAPAAIPVARSSHDPPSCRILVIDDDRAIRRMIRAVFSGTGQQVEDARDAAHALTLLEQADYDLVIADPRAAVSAGETFASACLARRPELRERMILITADVRAETEQWLRSLGCRFFRKPFPIGELQAAAGEVLRAGSAGRPRDTSASEAPA